MSHVLIFLYCRLFGFTKYNVFKSLSSSHTISYQKHLPFFTCNFLNTYIIYLFYAESYKSFLSVKEINPIGVSLREKQIISKRLKITSELHYIYFSKSLFYLLSRWQQKVIYNVILILYCIK